MKALTLLVNLYLELAKQISLCIYDPLRFVLFAFRWGELGGPLENYSGPEVWQAEVLADLGREVRKRQFQGVRAVQAIRIAIASGHGIGKSTLVAWIVLWIMSTRPGARGTITANTGLQLTTKTWPQIQKWAGWAINSHWFTVTNHSLYFRNTPETWGCSAQTCRVENSEAFAGQHAAASTSFYIFDEASGVPDKIFEVAEGGLTDGEPMIFMFGNPTRNTGKFYRAVSGAECHRWNHRSIDSRTVSFTNKAQIDEWIQDYGEDSDFVRVRVRGLPPTADELQFIDRARIEAARHREVTTFDDDPLIAGFDASGGGSAWNVVRFRRGMDARSRPPLRVPGEHSRDRDALLAKLAEIMGDERPGYKVQVMFVDSAFGAPYVERLHVLGYDNVVEVNFGGSSPDRHQENLRAYMWNQLKEWLPRGAISLDDEKLAMDLAGPGAHIRTNGKLVLESKADMQKRGIASPDDGDALALTFARQVGPLPKSEPADEEDFGRRQGGGYGSGGWMR